MGAAYCYGFSYDGTVRKLAASDAAQSWSFATFSEGFDGEADKDGNVYFGDKDDTHRKLNSSGVQQWSKSLVNYGRAAFCDYDGDYNYSGSDADYSGHVYLVKYNAAGTQQWAKSFDDNVYAGDVDMHNDQIWVGTGSSIVVVEPDNSDYEWDQPASGEQVYGIWVDHQKNGHVYIACGNGPIQKIERGDITSQVWGFDSGSSAYDIGTDEDLNVYYGQYYGYIAKLNSGGTQQWKTDFGSRCYGIWVDRDGDVYKGDTDGTMRKINTSGTQQWSKAFGDTVRHTAADPWLVSGFFPPILLGDF